MTDPPGENFIRDGEYDAPLSAAILEQYKMYVQTADNVSARRVSTNRYLLTLSAALIAVYGLHPSILDQWYLGVSIFTTGIAVSVLWYMIIKTHRDLNKAKFKLIHKLEQHLPAELFVRELNMTEKNSSKSYINATAIERWIPFLFAGLHVFLLASILWSAL